MTCYCTVPNCTLVQWVASLMVMGQQYIDSEGSSIQCMQDKGNGEAAVQT